MIDFRILACPDKSQQSTYRHAGRQLTMGSSQGDMLIDDPALAPAQIRIFWHGNGYFLENLEPDVEVRLNGKPVADPTPIKERDNINMGRTTVNFLAMNTNPLMPPEKVENPQIAARFTEGSKEKAIVDVLDILYKAESTTNPAGPGAGRPPLPPGMPPLPGKN